MDEGRKEIYTEKFTVGRRSYFLDVKESKDRIKYLVISESDLSNPTHPHNRVMIFDEAIDSFDNAYQNTLSILRPKKQSTHMQNIKAQHKRAYEQWTKEEDERLEEQFRGGANIITLSNLFERQEGAIKSRLTKLGIIKPN